MIITLDYETRSRADLPSVGAHRYACDPSTEVLMCGVNELLWQNPKFSDDTSENAEAERLIAEAELIYAHNAPFEQAITWGTSIFDIPIHKWRCTAALARKAGLPAKLEKLAEALGLAEQKDKKGKNLIKLFSMPQKDGSFVDPRSRPVEWKQFCEYCRQDIKTEMAVHQRLQAFELTGLPLETFLFDLRMNQLGVPVNVQALRNAQSIIDTVTERVTKEFVSLTGLNPTQRERVRLLVGLPDMQGETVEAALAKPGYNPHKRVLELYHLLSYAAVKKVQSMLDWACPDGRLRGCFKYHGAATGRWTSSGPQIQNVKKPSKEMSKLTDAAYAAISNGITADGLAAIYGDPYEVVANCIRQFVHLPGSELLDGDYNAIEGRIACWISKQTDILEDWRQGKDLYRRATAFVEGITEAEVDAQGRAFGKVIELAAQYGLGTTGFIRTCANWGIPCTEEKAEKAIHEYYRPTHREIVNRWWQHGRDMLGAITRPNEPHGVFTVKRIAGIQYLLLKLPSGRSLAYPHIEVNKREPTAEERKEMLAGRTFHEDRFWEITYWGQLPMSQAWGRVRLYGSLAFQNEVQAIAADVMAHGAINAERRGMPPFALIHDQGLAVRTGGKTAEEFAAALADLPAWARGLPLKVEAKVAPYYKK